MFHHPRSRFHIFHSEHIQHDPSGQDVGGVNDGADVRSQLFPVVSVPRLVEALDGPDLLEVAELENGQLSSKFEW